jgi:rhodanese-related sulfurtransferase
VLELQAKGFPQVACLLGGMETWAREGGAMVNAPK